ncbi:MAG TPA: 2,3,4,5-tetrahydropyridine-2,6-dicarboxylate N-succinyltransferase, partial [Polyangiales bacterium]|nr:2,3,4,5-tetrahydropyridine-2,6-dicarboxylate N-succinyltransferase [Polyangiales bacterium]
MTSDTQSLVEAAYADRSLLKDPAHVQAVLDTLEQLDKGKLRVATPPGTYQGAEQSSRPADPDGEWTTH